MSHIRDPADADRLADSASNRLLYRYAIPLCRHAADAGDEYAAMGLAVLLATNSLGEPGDPYCSRTSHSITGIAVFPLAHGPKWM